MANERDDVMGKVALGATGVALAAGGIAAAVYLTNKKNRMGVSKAAGRTFKKLGKVRDTFQSVANDRYQAVAHRIGAGKTNTKKVKKSASESSKRGSNHAVLHKIELDKGQKDKMSSQGRGRKQKGGKS
jgi:hypothetical protein